MRLMNADDLHDPVNLGNPGEFSIRQLAETIADVCGSKLTIEYRPLPQDDPTQRKPDITRAQSLLQWSPTVALRQGLERTVPYFADRLKRKGPTKKGAAAAADDFPFVERRRAYTEAGTWTDRPAI
jgi:UDP-glucuronate decarboxylase